MVQNSPPVEKRKDQEFTHAIHQIVVKVKFTQMTTMRRRNDARRMINISYV